MRSRLSYRGAALAAAVWLAVALPAYYAYGVFNMTFAVWLPSGIAVAALMLVPMRRWPLVMAIFACGSFWLNFKLGLPIAFLLTHFLNTVMQPTLTAWLLLKLVRGTMVDTMSLSDLIGLTAAALIGALPTIVPLALVLRDPTFTVIQYYLTMVLGTIIVTPIALSMKDKVARRADRRMWRHIVQQVSFGIALFALAYVVLGIDRIPLLFLCAAVIVVAVARFGQIGASIGVFALGMAVTIRSAGGQSPAAFLDLSPMQAVVYLQVYMLSVTAVSLPLAALLNEHNRLARNLVARNHELHHDMTVFSLAETLARIGRWRLDLATGECWFSPELKRMFGYSADAEVTFAQLAASTSDNGADFRSSLAMRRASRTPWRMELRIRRLDGQERIVETIAVNEFDDDGQVLENLGVVIDVTEQRRREEALSEERTRAMRLAAEANLLAQTDPLTGLANRRRTLAQLEKCVARSRSEDSTLSLVVFDIDYFKRINDTYGHQVGDEVLIRVADIARQQIRECDLIGRTGGEEFVWLLPRADAKEACIAAERLRRAIERDSSLNGLPGVTVSVGYATFQDSDDANVLFSRADAALYEAKRDGRNCVTMAA